MKSLSKDIPKSVLIGGGVVLTSVALGGLVIYQNSLKDDNNISQTNNIKNFKDGTYYAEGTFYVEALGKSESVGVTVTIKDGNIVSVETDQVEAGQKVANDYMQKFEDKIKTIVVGKSINEVDDQTIVTGSSLTSEGFQQAVENIRREAAL
ncbi:FMN-binding protein [Candidatus Dojkabacteria bacterium]|uniref:FMN-binding protein n=1 Tax=Candidatus Dojkabacteria bacterium TaxID=2099670 RepID=A0A955L1U6_9BACT|nr:FMN-binding protein [Candidatus Dojkabacteria bacterium]